MLFCNECGQCKHIGTDDFIAIVCVSGIEKQYVDCINGEYTESEGYEDMESGDSETQCPHCRNTDIEYDWDGSEEEAFEKRADYEAARKRMQLEREMMYQASRIKDSEWDLETNSVYR